MRPTPSLRALLSMIVALLAVPLVPAIAAPPAAPAPTGSTVAVLAEDFEFHGDWLLRPDLKVKVLASAPEAGPNAKPAATAVAIPAAGRYHLWVCTRDFPNDRPGTRTFRVGIGTKVADKTFGASNKEGYTWEDGGAFDLVAGPLLITLRAVKPYARAQGVILTTDAKYQPTDPLSATGKLKPTKPLSITPASGGGGNRAAGDVTIAAGERPSAMLANESVRIEFVPAKRNGQATVAPRFSLKQGEAWVEAKLDATAEGYFAVTAVAGAKLSHAGFAAVWERDATAKPVTVEVGGASVQTLPGKSGNAMWQAGTLQQFLPRKAMQEGPTAVRLEFAPTPAGKLEALWQLPAGAPVASVALTFTPVAEGQAALGYELFVRRELLKVNELLLPFMYQRHRLPERPVTLLNNCTPTPLALVEPQAEAGQPARTFAVIGDPADIAYGWPDGRTVNWGLSISDEGGRVQPSIWGPVIGTPAAAAHVGKPLTMRFRVLVQAGDWYAAYRTVVDQVFGVTDYRSNVATSLTDAALNMIDLVMDDEHGGWWERGKAWYQIESKNGSSHASPMTLLSLYRLSGDERVYRRRALPTMQFMLSRNGPHFSPVPDDTGIYPAGSMDGPSKLFGTTTYAGLYKLSGGRTDAFAAIALPKDGVRSTVGYSHAQLFDEWMARYELTGDKADLEKACALADKYVEEHVAKPPAKDLGPEPFFYISFVPDWEGLLRLYEVSGRKQYLDAAAFGARQLMTGVWTQAPIPPGDVTVHPGNEFLGDAKQIWSKGPDKFRLGWPPAPGAITEHKVPAWTVSNIGLSFEQPVTFNASGVARQIFEEAWAPHFLRLYRYTRDAAFLTYARNATVGRWGNYPGYYAMGHTDLPQNPRYTFTGPDISSIYYHHIPAHLAWTIDYLVTEAETLSDGKIAFPGVRQHGYAYFDSRVFGHAPGKVFEDEDAWLVFRRGVLTIDNVQVNYLLAHGRGGVQVILTNQSQQQQACTVTLSAEQLGAGASQPVVARLADGKPAAVRQQGNQVALTLAPRQLVVLTVAKAELKSPPLHPAASTRLPKGDAAIVALDDGVAQTRAAAIQADPGAWDAYVWSTASPKQAKAATLHYAVGQGAAQAVECAQYPFEFSIPVKDAQAAVRFELELTKPDGSKVRGPQGVVKLN